MALGRKLGLDPSDIMLDGDPAHSPLKGSRAPKFSAIVYCGQTAGWTKMPLGMMVGLGTGNTVFDADPAPSTQVAQPPPIFGPCLLWPNGWMDQDGTWYEGRPRPRPQCVTWGPSSPPKTGAQLLNFRPMSIGQTVAHLSYC